MRTRTSHWHIVYLWHGERHVTPAFVNRDDAADALQSFRADGFHAWIEEIH